MSTCFGITRYFKRRRRWQGLLQIAILAGITFSIVGFSFISGKAYKPQKFTSAGARTLLQVTEPTTEEANSSLLEATNTTDDALFPEDLFTLEQRQNGAIVLHCLGMLYMFIALAIVCDEFFVPALDVIIEKLEISEDVAGATFMAAGGSAPELFTSVIGVFISFNDVGIGTIVGSAVFNILFVIAMCVLFSKTVLDLTWWPIFRDVTFYSIALLMLVLFFLDGKIYWYEALLLFIVYILYCGFMKVNETFERFVKKHIYKNKVTRVCSTDQLVPNHNLPPPTLPGMSARRPSAPVLHSGTKFRQGLLQLMIHTIDPLHDEGKVDDKATQLHAIASLKVLLDATKPQNGRVETCRQEGIPEEPSMEVPSHVSGRPSTEVTQVIGTPDAAIQAQTNGDLNGENYPNNVSYSTRAIRRISYKAAQNNDHMLSATDFDPETMSPGVSTIEDMIDEQENKPVDLSWPDTTRKRIIYIIVAPLIIPLWLTLPDPRTPRGKRFFFVTFVGSIVWIAVFSYLMVWWATITGDTFNIPAPVMGLTILAAGTSVPDLITSVIVARKGFGDMAVSSSIGSNIFDVCVGLPVPWMLFAFFQLVSNLYNKVDNPWTVNPISVSSAGMACSIMLLFTMLMFVLVSIICSKWKMNKGLGASMFLLYFVFVGISLSFEYDLLKCPI